MNNVEKIRKRFGSMNTGGGNAKSEATYILGAMQKMAVALSAYMRGEAEIPVDTHNLKDSTGIALYSPGGVLRTYIPNPKAEVPKTTRGLGVYERPRFGYSELQHAIFTGARKYNNGYYLVIFSAMPYAGVVQNHNGNRYFDRILAASSTELAQILRVYKNLTAKPA